jgi:hypothetical protein
MQRQPEQVPTSLWRDRLVKLNEDYQTTFARLPGFGIGDDNKAVHSHDDSNAGSSQDAAVCTHIGGIDAEMRYIRYQLAADSGAQRGNEMTGVPVRTDEISANLQAPILNEIPVRSNVLYGLHWLYSMKNIAEAEIKGLCGDESEPTEEHKAIKQAWVGHLENLNKAIEEGTQRD